MLVLAWLTPNMSWTNKDVDVKSTDGTLYLTWQDHGLMLLDVTSREDMT